MQPRSLLVAAAAASGAFLALAAAACGGRTESAPPSGPEGGVDATQPHVDAASPHDSGVTDADSSVADADASITDAAADSSDVIESGVSCPAPADDAGLAVFQSAANGSVVGPDVATTVCNASAFVFTQSYASFPTATYLKVAYGAFQFTTPASPSDPYLSGDMQIAAAAPGTYTSSDATNCGNVSLSFTMPAPAGVDCGDGSVVGPVCPAGCSSACAGTSCTPCSPDLPQGFYSAQGGATCFDVTEPAIGSWTITLTSVTPYPYDGGGPKTRLYYAAHGTLVAILLGNNGEADAGQEPATLTLTF
jgi:hypothetical protein